MLFNQDASIMIIECNLFFSIYGIKEEVSGSQKTYLASEIG